MKAITDNIAEYQSERPLAPREAARIWQHTTRDGVELLRGTYHTYRAARHFHTVPAIGIVADGAMTSYYRGGTHLLPTGTVFLINPGEVHAPAPAGAAGWVLRAFYFQNDVYRQLSNGVGQTPLRFSQAFIQDRWLTRGLLALHRAMEAPADAVGCDSAFAVIFARLAERYACEPGGSLNAAREHRSIDRVKDYIAEYSGSRLRLRELAEVGELSPYHLLRTFRKTVGLTPHAYLTQVRVHVAMNLLRQGQAISEAAFHAGFVDQSHFTRHFKLIMGVTPGQFRSRASSRASSRATRPDAEDGWRWAR